VGGGGNVEVRRGGERRNSKRKEDLKRRKTDDFKTKTTRFNKKQNKHSFVCYFRIEKLCLICPPYNIQKTLYRSCYREKYPSIRQL
jgi:hypothetical protein